MDTLPGQVSRTRRAYARRVGTVEDRSAVKAATVTRMRPEKAGAAVWSPDPVPVSWPDSPKVGLARVDVVRVDSVADSWLEGVVTIDLSSPALSMSAAAAAEDRVSDGVTARAAATDAAAVALKVAGSPSVLTARSE